MMDTDKWALDRRQLLQLAAGSGFTGVVAETASAREQAEEVTVTGEIQLYNENSDADQWLVVSRPDGEEIDSDHFTPDEGTFSVTVPAGEQLPYVFYQGNSDTDTYVVFDDNPDLRALGERKYPSDTTIDPIELPKGHRLDVRVVDKDGNPVEGAPARVRHDKYTSWGWIDGTTTADGLFKAHHTKPGIEVEGNITVRAAPPGTENPFSGDSDAVTSKELTVTSPTEVTIRLGDVTRTTPEQKSSEKLPEITKAVGSVYVGKGDDRSEVQEDSGAVWLVGEQISFQITLRANDDVGYTGEVYVNISFIDLPGEGGIDVGWAVGSERAATLRTFQTKQSVDLAPGETTRFSKTIEISDKFEQTINGFKPSLTLTDQVRVGLAGPENPDNNKDRIYDDCQGTRRCVKPEDIAIAIDIHDLAAFGLAIFGALTARSLAGGAAPDPASVLQMSAESWSYFIAAADDIRAEEWDRVERHFETGLEEGGVPPQSAKPLARHLKNAIKAGTNDEIGRATGEFLLVGVELSLLPMGSQELTFPSSPTELWDSVVSAMDQLFGDLALVSDVVGTVMRAQANLEVPELQVHETASQTFAPTSISGRVTDQAEDPIANADVSIYNRNPRTADVDPIQPAVTTDKDGYFDTQELGPEKTTPLWFDITKNSRTLTETPAKRWYRPTRGGIPRMMRFTVNTFEKVSRPEISVSLNTTVNSDGNVVARITESGATQGTDVTDWDSAGGIHLRVIGGNFVSIDNGAFDRRNLASAIGVPVESLENASIVELVSATPMEAGEQRQTGPVVIEPTEGADEITLAYRAWGYDTDPKLTVDGQSVPYIARAPPGANYNRHEVEDGFTFLNYLEFTERTAIKDLQGDTEKQLSVQKADLTGDGTEDIQAENGEIFVRTSGKHLESQRLVSQAGQAGGNTVVSPIETRPMTPDGVKPKFESLNGFQITKQSGDVRSYRVDRTYTLGDVPLNIIADISVVAQQRFSFMELTYENAGETVVQLDQKPGHIHDGLLLVEGLQLANRNDSDGQYRFHLPEVGTKTFSGVQKWTTFPGTSWGTIFDSQDAVTVGLLTGATKPKMWVEERGQLDYLASEYELNPGGSLSYTTVFGIHDGGTDAPETGQEIIDTALNHLKNADA